MKKLLFFGFLLLFSGKLAAQDAASLQNYVGKYNFSAGSPLTDLVVSTVNGKLYGVATGQGEASLTPTAKADVFKVEGYDGNVTFIRENGIVKGLSLAIMGQDMSAKRVFPPQTDYVGTYVFEAGPITSIDVTSEEGIVYGDVANLGKGAFNATSNLDEFTESNYNSIISFVRNAEGKVTSIRILAQGAEMIGKKK